MFKDCFKQYHRNVLFPLYSEMMDAKIDNNLPLLLITEQMYEDAYQAYLEAIDQEARDIWTDWNS